MNTAPGFDFSQITELHGVLDTRFLFYKIATNSCLPAIVTEVYGREHKVDLKILAKRKYRLDDNSIKFEEREELKGIPFIKMCHGGYMIDFPVKKGDTGWVIAADRQNEDIREKNAAKNPEDNEGPQDLSSDGMGEFSFGFFIPDCWHVPSEDEYEADSQSLIIRKISDNEDGPNEVVINDYGVFISSGKYGAKITNYSASIHSSDESATIDKDGFTFSGKCDETINIITDIRYDMSSHQLQKKIRECEKRGTFITKVGDESEWLMLDGGQAVPETV